MHTGVESHQRASDDHTTTVVPSLCCRLTAAARSSRRLLFKWRGVRRWVCQSGHGRTVPAARFRVGGALTAFGQIKYS